MDKAPHVTSTDIETYLSLEEERLELGRKARDLEKKAEPLKKKLKEFVRIKGGKALSTVRSGFRLALELVNGSVSWKPEFIRVAGQDAADEIIAACPKRESLSVERVGG
jgi:hypothetical protein